jgi:predicted NodU family carbamoyl transferase
MGSEHLEPWIDLPAVTGALDSREPLLVSWPSHVPESFESLSGAWGTFGASVSRVRELLDSGARVVLVHRLSSATLWAFPDLVRWVDDVFREVAGLRLELDTEDSPMERSDFAMWWGSGISTAKARELGLQIGEGLPQVPWAALSPPPTEPASWPHPEPVSCLTRPQGPGWSARLVELLEPIGSLARFIYWKQLEISEEQLWRYIEEEPRDRARVERKARPDPWVGIFVSPDSDPDLVYAIVKACAEYLTLPRVIVREAHPGQADGLEDAAERGGGRLTRVGTSELPAEELIFDYVIHIASLKAEPFSGSVEQTLSLLDADARAAQMAQLTKTYQEKSVDLHTPLSMWTHTAWGDEVSVPLDSGEILDLEGFRTDLWILDAPELGVVLASTDPVPMDHFAIDALQIAPGEVPWHAAALEVECPFVTHEGTMVGGDFNVDVVNRPTYDRVKLRSKPLTILGIASTTLANHSATVLRDGQVVAAVQEERLRRRKQLGWHPPGRPHTTVVSDPAIPLSQAYPKRAIACALKMAGLTMDEVDIVAINGIPARYFPTYSLREPERPPVTIRAGKTIFVPHHLAHAASTYRVSGMEDAFVFTVDGRGERETAGFFEARDGELHRTFDVLVNEDSLIGGVYEYITTILGFGHHGAGSTMGLAPLGEATLDLSAFLSARSRSDYTIHDHGIEEVFGHLRRHWGGALEPGHTSLAASAQRALEDTVIQFIRDGLGGRSPDNLCLAGGVALNCAMNQRIRTELGVGRIFVQPGANDAGTSLGAALEAHWDITGEAVPFEMDNAYLGPGYTDDEIEAVLKAWGLPYDRVEDIATEAAERIVDGHIVCWFQGRLEFGPRALGARSILSDPRDIKMKERVNVIKGRQWWRPFGPSILAGHEADWFLTPFETPFMLFTLPVRPEKVDQIPAVTHVDDTTRPQSVTERANPLYHRLISKFYERTGVPMVTNTSFNTAFEPIVCSPQEAISSFLQLGADDLAIGPFLVTRADIQRRL